MVGCCGFGTGRGGGGAGGWITGGEGLSEGVGRGGGEEGLTGSGGRLGCCGHLFFGGDGGVGGGFVEWRGVVECQDIGNVYSLKLARGAAMAAFSK